MKIKTRGRAAQKLDQSAARIVDHLRDVHSTHLQPDLSALALSLSGRAARSAGLQAERAAWPLTRATRPPVAACASDSSCLWS